MDSFTAWQSLEDFRREAERNKMYVFGDQWGDRITYNRKSMTERESIRMQGNVPVTNNRLRALVRTVSGVFQANRTEPVCIARERDAQEKGEVMSATLQYVYQMNKIWDLDISALTNILVSGLAAYRSGYGYRNGQVDIWTDLISHNRFFFDNGMEDIRQWDCRLAGEIEDMSVYDAMARFAGGSREKAEQIRRIYSYVNRERLASYAQAYAGNARDYRNFFMADDDTKCRVITTWRKEAKERLLVHDTLNGDYYKTEISDEQNIMSENQRRIAEQSAAGILPENMKLLKYQWFVDNYWYFYNQAPTGEILREGETPYWHGSHPYSFKLYTFYDKRIFPFISGFIDQQRYINRLIMMQDFMMRSAAKGVLMIPDYCIEDTGRTPEQFAEDWVKFNGVIVYSPRAGMPMPQQITANSTQLGVYDMLSLQLKMLEDISGVQGALQGKAPNAGTPAALYAQQTQNASTSLQEVFSIFRMLREERDMKNLKLIQQFYDAPRLINVSGNARNMVMYDPDKVMNAEFELSIVESVSTPAFRMIINDTLMNLLNGGHITIRELLENGSLPFADKLLQSIDNRERQMQQVMQSGGQIDPAAFEAVSGDVQSAIAQEANPNVMNMYNQMMGGTT
jgi:hypothetical protein